MREGKREEWRRERERDGGVEEVCVASGEGISEKKGKDEGQRRKTLEGESVEIHL